MLITIACFACKNNYRDLATSDCGSISVSPDVFPQLCTNVEWILYSDNAHFVPNNNYFSIKASISSL